MRWRGAMAVSAKTVTRSGVKRTARLEMAKMLPIWELLRLRSARRTEKEGMIEPSTAKERKYWGLVEWATEGEIYWGVG